jgi:hypothetical protein
MPRVDSSARAHYVRRDATQEADRLVSGTGIIAAVEQSPLQSVQQDKHQAGEESSASGAMDRRSHAENGNVESPSTVDESDPVEVELDAKLEALLTKDVELSAKYGTSLLNHRRTRRERRAMRAELRRLHTEEGGVLLEVKVHRARKGRGGQWEQYLRQTKPKPLSRTTADRWIGWFLDSQEQSKSAQPPGEAPENAPQNESGAFSCGDAQSPPASSDSQQPVATDSTIEDGSEAFEDLQELKIVFKKSKMARFKASTHFLVVKKGFETSHEAIYSTVDEAATRIGFVYPTTVADQGETTDASKGINPGSETPAEGSNAA